MTIILNCSRRLLNISVRAVVGLPYAVLIACRSNLPGAAECSEPRNEEVMSVATDIPPGGSSCIRRVALDLEYPLLQVGAVDGVYVVVEDVPAGIRLTAGRCNG